MVAFLGMATLLVALALLMVVPGLWRGRTVRVQEERDGQNVEFARERLAELEREFSEGVVDETAFEAAKQELERVLLDDLQSEQPTVAESSGARASRNASLTLLLVLPLLTALLYWQLGSPESVRLAANAVPPSDPHTSNEEAMPTMEEVVERLATRLANEPENVEGWFTLGRTYMSMRRYGEAVSALEKVNTLLGEHPTVMLALADALTMRNGGRMQGRPTELVRKALALEPDNTTALWLAGMAAEEEGRYAEAIALWRRLEPALKERPDSLREVRQLISAAEEQLGEASDSEVSAAPLNTEEAPLSIRVEVTLDASLKEALKVEDTLFVYARAESGPPMPLAVVRASAAELPVQVTLDDTMAMMPQMRLSAFEQVVVGARLSASGDAIKQSGDLMGEVRGVAVRRDNVDVVSVTINQRVP